MSSNQQIQEPHYSLLLRKAITVTAHMIRCYFDHHFPFFLYTVFKSDLVNTVMLCSPKPQ